jgi:OmcA/MtrC family decaheme c-type cytochrome
MIFRGGKACLATVMSLVTGSWLISSTAISPYTPRDKAYYANAAAVDFVRPGLQLKILSAAIDEQGVIKVRFKITDPRGLPLDRLGVTTPGTVSLSFVAATLPSNTTQYTAYTTRLQTSPITGQSATQASADTGGSYEQVGEGEYVYTFGTRAPANFDRSATHAIGIYSSRDLTEFDLGTNFADAVFLFVPDGSPVKSVRDVVRTENCNRCHDPLSAHGGARRSVELCVLCHTPQTMDPDTGNTVDFPVMVHKIHMGANLPSVKAGKPYRIIGFGQSVADFSTVEFPADVRRCEVCHEPRPDATPAAVAAQKNNYLTRPNRAACGACHDNVNFATGENHVDLPQVSDNQCAICHTPQGELEFDASIKGAHVIPTHSSMLPGVVFDILSVDNTGPGQRPTVTFSVKDKAGKPIALTDMARVTLINGGPTSDYSTYVSEDATRASGSQGVYTYTFQSPVPPDAKGTFAIGIEGYRNITLLPGTKKEMPNVRDVGTNKIFYYAVTDSKPVPRRTVVMEAKCDSCHAFLEAHGSIRNQVEYCVICHNPNENDRVRRPASQMPPESIHFKTMIHKIHTGEDLKTDFTIFGFGGSKNNFNEVRFPGDRRDCSTCHVGNSEQLPLREGLLASQAPRDPINPQPPATAACLSCHTGLPAASHALLNTSQLGEACEVCHGQNAEFSVSKVHAR